MNARDVIQEIEQRHGYLTPKIVVDEARPKSHPLHAVIFDRTPSEAAEAWWLHRAQEIIQSVRVRYTGADGESQSIRQYVSVITPERGPVYMDVDRVAEDPIAKAIVLREMEREWRQLRGRYEKYSEFWTLVASTVTAG
jgi:hypothetical protein